MKVAQRLVLLGSFTVTGCQGGVVDPWPGDWQAAEERMLRFYPDGKVDYYSRGTKFARGTYTRLGWRYARVDMTSTMPRASPSGPRMFIVKLGEEQTFDFNRIRFRRRR